MTWGATPDDWAHFATTLYLQADLLPVVSNPGAKISPASKMRELGKTPSRYDANGLVVGIPKWTQLKSTDRDIGRWSQHSDLGICLQTRRVRAIDIDRQRLRCPTDCELTQPVALLAKHCVEFVRNG